MFFTILILYYLTLGRGICCSFKDNVNYSKSHHVDLSYRHLTEIPQNIPIDTESLDLSFNDIKNVPNDIFANLSNIKTLNLFSNTINVILVNSFKGLSKIEYLNLGWNQLKYESLQNESFNHISSLQILIIYGNPDDGTSSISFSDELYRLRLLHTLHLDGIDHEPNKLNKFECFKNLKVLAFEYPTISVENTTFKSLQNLPIEELGLLSLRSVQTNALSFFPKLQKLALHLSWRALSSEKIFPALEVFKGRRMTSISMTGNPDSYPLTLGLPHLRYLWDICLRELYLPTNFIVDIDPSSFSIFAKKSTCLEIFDMSDNPVQGNRIYTWVLSFTLFKNLKVIRFSHIGFRPSSESSVHKSIGIKFELLLPSTLQELSVNYGYTRFGLPNVTFIDGQSMKILSLLQMKVTHCLGSFVGLPNLTELDISGFDCTTLNPDILQFLPRLERFTAQNTNLSHGLNFVPESGARLFLNLSNLHYVDLASNNIGSLHSDMFKDQQETLRYLKLGNNALKSIPISINKFKLLKLLDLTSNKIEYFDEVERELLDKNNHADIRLSGNPFMCTCDRRIFLRWIKERGMKYFVNVECIGEDRIWHNISEIIRSLDNFELRCVVTFWLYFAIIMSSIVYVLVIIFSIYYRYRSEIQYFFLKLKISMKRYNTLEERDEYQFDAFVSYRSSDSSWVTQFYRKLTNNGFNICIDFIHFVGGDGIAENIVRAIDCSRKIIFIVTRDFLKSSWGGYEIEMTRMHAFREGRENMVILILKDEIPIEEMPRPLKEMWDKIVCLKYYDTEETNFYESVALCLR